MHRFCCLLSVVVGCHTTQSIFGGGINTLGAITDSYQSRILRKDFMEEGHPRRMQEQSVLEQIQSTNTITAKLTKISCIKNETLQVQPKPHPHAGARDECQNYGYHHDPTAALIDRKQQHQSVDYWVDYDKVCEVPMGQGSEGPGGYEALQKIQIAPKSSFTDTRNKPLRLLCMVYSVDNPHSNAMVKAVRETWGSRCDGFLVASNVTNPSLGMVDIPHLGPEDYGSMWQKVRSMWAYVHDQNYLEEYDFVYISGEDTYVIVENLRKIIYEAHEGRLYKDPNWYPTKQREVERVEEQYALDGKKERPLYLGAIYAQAKNRYVCAGGAGYVLNRPAIQKLIQGLPDTQPDTIDSKEDFFVAATLRKQSIACSDTRDSTGAWTFHHLDAQFQANFDEDNQRNAVYQPAIMERSRNIKSKFGLEGVSESSVSFHLTTSRKIKASPERLRRYHAILYGLCGKETPSTLG